MNSVTRLPNLLFMDIGTPTYDYASEHIFAMKSGAQLPFCNRVYGTAHATSQEIAHLRAFYGATPFRWFVENSDAAQCRLLEQEGLQYKISFPAMHLPLKDLKPAAYKNDVRVEKVQDLETWLATIVPAYKIADAAEFEKFLSYLKTRAGSEHVHFYLAYLGSTPAAASMAIDHGDAIGLHYVGTLPEYRSKGLGHAVSHFALADAKERGVSQALLFTSELGKPVYENLGFKEFASYKIYG